MKHVPLKISISVIVFSILLVSVSASFADTKSIPDWIKTNAGWWAGGTVDDATYLNAIKFLIENDILIIDSTKGFGAILDASVTIPNGNSDIEGVGFYLPLNLEIPRGTTVTWTNDDSVPHNIQSLDESGKIIDWFNSAPLNTGDRFEFTFEESGVFNYYCSFHPWRVGTVTVK